MLINFIFPYEFRYGIIFFTIFHLRTATEAGNIQYTQSVSEIYCVYILTWKNGSYHIYYVTKIHLFIRSFICYSYNTFKLIASRSQGRLASDILDTTAKVSTLTGLFHCTYTVSTE